MEEVIQRVVFPAERRIEAMYCRLLGSRDGSPDDVAYLGRFSAEVVGGSVLSTDTYFNSFFESYWRAYTRLDRLRLRLRLDGAGVVRLLRRSTAKGRELLDVVAFDGDAAEVVLDVPLPALTFRDGGALHFEVAARSARVLLRGAEWVAVGVEAAPVRLVAAYCTFEREEYLLANVRALLSDPAVAAGLERVVVVDQGNRKVASHPAFGPLSDEAGGKLRVVEQGNFGGAGGFTRAILEARDMPAATHVLLMDDDAVVEPESVFRATAFLALARSAVAVGAPNLDLFRPREMHEAGGRIDAAGLQFVPHAGHGLDLGEPESLAPFLDVTRPDYNAWIFFAFPLSLIDRIGLPLPFFIRGDDIEFGLRVSHAGVPSVTLPGTGVWHEPGYVKSRHGAWYPYYNLRNVLALLALHAPVSRLRIVRTFLKRLAGRLLSLDYYEAALLCDAVEDFCRGPAVLEGDPQRIHQGLLARRREWGGQVIPRTGRLAEYRSAAPPASRVRRAWHLLGSLARQTLRPGPAGDAPPSGLIDEARADQWSIGRADVVAVDNWYRDQHVVLRRSRGAFLRLLGRGLKAAWRLFRGHARISGEWRDAAGRMAGCEFWGRYLGIGPGGRSPGEQVRRAA